MSVASFQNLVPTTTLNASIAWGVLIVCVRRASLKSIESVFVSTLIKGLLAYFVFALPLCKSEDHWKPWHNFYVGYHKLPLTSPRLIHLRSGYSI